MPAPSAISVNMTMKNKLRIPALVLGFLLVFSCQGISAFADEPDTGIIDAAYLDSWLSENYPADVSVGFIYTRTGDAYYYNADDWMYSASMYKVCANMLLSEKMRDEGFGLSDTYNGMTWEYLMSSSLVASNNDSGHYIVDYLGGTYSGKASDQAKKFAPSLADDYYTQDFYDYSYYTARFMTEVMRTLYEGGDEQYPYVQSYMRQAQPDDYFHEKLGDRYEIEQKYGAFEEKTGNKLNHCTGIIYTPTPIIVTVMTRNVSAWMDKIGDISQFLADYSLELDLLPDPTPQPTPVPAEVVPTEEPVAVPTATASPVPTSMPTIPDTQEHGNGIIYVLFIIAAATAGILIFRKKAKPSPKKKKESYQPKH